MHLVHSQPIFKWWLIYQTRGRKYVIDLTSLSYALASWQCCTHCSTVALGETPPSATITCKWKMITNIEKMHSSFPTRWRISQNISTEIIVVLESASDIKKYDYSLFYWWFHAEFSAVLPKYTDSQGSHLLAPNSAWQLQVVIRLHGQTEIASWSKVQMYLNIKYRMGPQV